MADQIELDACNPTKLGLMLNFSVFMFEQMSNPEKACDMVEQALERAID